MKYHCHESYGWLCSSARIDCHINLCVLQNSYLFHDVGAGYSQFTKAHVKSLLSNTNTRQKLWSKVCHVSVPARSPDPAEQEMTCAMLYYVMWEWNHCCQSPTVSISKTVKGPSHSDTEDTEIQKRAKQSCWNGFRIRPEVHSDFVLTVWLSGNTKLNLKHIFYRNCDEHFFHVYDKNRMFPVLAHRPVRTKLCHFVVEMSCVSRFKFPWLHNKNDIMSGPHSCNILWNLCFVPLLHQRCPKCPSFLFVSLFIYSFQINTFQIVHNINHVVQK